MTKHLYLVFRLAALAAIHPSLIYYQRSWIISFEGAGCLAGTNPAAWLGGALRTRRAFA
jgi:hypothetical protein